MVREPTQNELSDEYLKTWVTLTQKEGPLEEMTLFTDLGLKAHRFPMISVSRAF